ncbi:UDP-glycosyltransferase 73C6-like [Ricinus communis]|uniref:UDP-glycosyltransferase 73C6-like n=1 Tax=Ricinus communis TaxID=3988 RepID=UPI00201A827E|nr:UDP-glycosyltransferase 73C6-like [Ricinus communis]
MARLLAKHGMIVSTVTAPLNSKRFASILPSLHLSTDFFSASHLLHKPAERLLVEVEPRPICIISDTSLPFTSQIACKAFQKQLVEAMFGNIQVLMEPTVEAEMISYGICSMMRLFLILLKSWNQDMSKNTKKANGNKAKCIGPVSLCNKDNYLDNLQKGDLKNLNA